MCVTICNEEKCQTRVDSLAYRGRPAPNNYRQRELLQLTEFSGVSGLFVAINAYLSALCDVKLEKRIRKKMQRISKKNLDTQLG